MSNLAPFLVAILSYLGASSNGGAEYGPIIALAFFTLGIIQVGTIKVYRMLYLSSRSKIWAQNADLCILGEIDFGELQKRWAEARREPLWPYVTGYFSGICFVVGATTGFILLCTSAQ